jgi:hypothetical protein
VPSLLPALLLLLSCKVPAAFCWVLLVLMPFVLLLLSTARGLTRGGRQKPHEACSRFEKRQI